MDRSDIFHRLQGMIPDPQRELFTSAAKTAAAVAFGYFTRWAIEDYKAYLALGPGGLPYNLFGWAVANVAIRPFCLSKAGAISTDDYPADGAHTDIEGLPSRQGKRAQIAGIVPHRQVSQVAPERMKTFVYNLFENAASANPQLLEKRISGYERHNDALFVAKKLLETQPSSLPRAAIMAKGELGHSHDELSVHLYLSPADARQVIEKGWGERHRLAVPLNTWFRHRYGVADTYLMIYGPRDEDEMEGLSVILESSIRFMTGQDVGTIGWKTLN